LSFVDTIRCTLAPSQMSMLHSLSSESIRSVCPCQRRMVFSPIVHLCSLTPLLFLSPSPLHLPLLLSSSSCIPVVVVAALSRTCRFSVTWLLLYHSRCTTLTVPLSVYYSHCTALSVLLSLYCSHCYSYTARIAINALLSVYCSQCTCFLSHCSHCIALKLL
jgi:hypothetical protein